MRRGEIYFIQRHDTVGSETAKSRPGVIISNNVLNATSDVVEVVYLTTAPKKDMPTHVVIKATGIESTVLCEHIDHVSKNLVGSWCGVCSEEEMREIETALLVSLGVEDKSGQVYYNKLVEAVEQLERLRDERDRYMKMVDHLLEAKA